MSVSGLLKFLANTNGITTIKSSRTSIKVLVDGATFSCRRVYQDPPHIDSVLKRSYHFIVQVNYHVLARALNCIKALSSPTLKSFNLSCQQNRLVIKSFSSMSEKIESRLEVESISTFTEEIDLHLEHVVDFLSNTRSKSVKVYFERVSRCVLIHDEEETLKHQYVLSTPHYT
jgi:DNA polymerase III sliding clamp (beta) subunit (PCNA family)